MTAAPKPMETVTPRAAPLPAALTAPPPAVTGQPKPARAPVSEGKPKTSLSLQFREWVEAVRQSARRSVGSVSAAGQLVAQRTLPDQAEVLHKKELEKRNNAIMLATAIAIPVLVALLITVMTMQHGAEAAVATHLGEAQNAITLAQGAVTGTDTRKYYAQAVAEAKLALAGAPNNEQGQQLLEQAQTELDKIDNVTRLTPTVLWDFKSPGPQHLTAQGNSLYAADRSTGRISRMVLTVSGDKLDGDPETLLNAGVAVDGQLPGELIDIVAMKSTTNRQASDIIIPHASGLLDYNPSFGMKTLDFGGNALAPDTKRVRSYEGNLYVLDTAQNQIWRYKPNGEGFPNPAERYLAEGIGLSAQATDMTIDGNVYVTTSGGQILKYTDGQTGTFQIKGLGQALQQPSLVTVDPNAQDSSVYVVDQATGHVLQFRPDGLFVRQFRADGPAFDNIQDLVVDEQNNRLYVITKGVLYTALLPSLR
jgi:outer membrane protein assembly factor BamB